MFNKFFGGDGCNNECGNNNGCGNNGFGCNCIDIIWIILLISLICNCGCKIDPCLLVLILLILNCCGGKNNHCGC